MVCNFLLKVFFNALVVRILKALFFLKEYEDEFNFIGYVLILSRFRILKHALIDNGSLFYYIRRYNTNLYCGGCVRDYAIVGALLWSAAKLKATRKSPTDFLKLTLL